MRRSTLLLAALALLVVSFATHVRSQEQVLIAAGSSWRYNDTGANLGTAWSAPAYDDTAWPAGTAQLGYGDGDESTVLSYGSDPSNRRITYYFRRTITVADPASIAALAVRYVRDDGCVIYLNGVEVLRSNMPSGVITSTTRASAAIGGTDESAWLVAPVPSSLLAPATNVIAVEVHQQAPSSTDVSFDLELRATPAQATAPAVTLTSPASGGVSNSAAVTFSASVSSATGLASATLLLGSAPQSLAFSGPAQLEDAQLSASTPTSPNGSGLSLTIDGSPHVHSLMRFPTLIGSLAAQVPPGSTITSAVLALNCTNIGNAVRLYRLTQSWVENQVTWNERATGSPWASAGADGLGSNAGVALTGTCTTTGQRLIDLTLFVQEWSSGTPNYGVVLTETGTDSVVFSSSESTSPPVLTVVYRTPQQPVQTITLSGTTAQVDFAATVPVGTYSWNVQATDAAGRSGSAPSDFLLTVDAAAPDAPVLVAPTNGAGDVVTSPALSALVSDPSGGPLNVSVSLRRAAAPEFTIIALPDTQHYSEAFPAVFASQTQWIVDNIAARNIVFVTHEGDLVENNSLVSEWEVANANMSMLDGRVPYGMGPGNHDQPTTLFNQYFPYTRYVGQPWYGGNFQNLNDNNYQLFSGGGLDFVIVHLAFCPPAPALSWADSVFKTYPTRVGIVTTHGYLNLSAQRTVHVCGSTQALWDGLAVPNPNVRFMLSGHVHGESRRTDSVSGRTVHQMLADYQNRASGGEGWLRILRFVPADDTVYVETYSPWLGRFETDADSAFTLAYPMGGAFEAAGSITAQSGSMASLPVTALLPNTTYEWRMTVTNSSGRSRTGPVWSFTTSANGEVNQPPTANSASVSLLEDTAVLITLTGSDAEGSPLAFTVVNPPQRGTLTGSAPTLTYQPAANVSGADTFTFRVNDGQVNSPLATVSVDVQPVNDPPVSVGESYAVQGNGTLAVSAPGVLSNDTDVEGTALLAQLLTVPSNGALTLNANGSFTYAPVIGYSGADAFTYQATDGQAVSGVATVNLAVSPGPVVPSLVGLTQATATAAIGGAGLTLGMVTTAAHATVPNGVVLSQTPGAGTSVPIGTAVALVVSTGPPLVAVPNVVNQPQATAATLIAGAGLTVGALSSAPHATIVAGNIVSQTPGAGANVPLATAVALVISTGPPTTTGLVAAYSFNEAAGTALLDRTGLSHAGAISGATWTTQARFGGALSFDGVNDWVTINDAADLDLTTAMTLEAWVRPTSSGAWRSVLLKEQTGGLVYSVYATDGAARPAGWVTVGGEVATTAPAALALNTWTHLAFTYDGVTLRLFVNGVQTASQARAGAMAASTGVLRLGGNSVWGEYFQGQIDEVRVYNRALGQSEIQSDMTTPVTP